jgi:universal stress protein A
MAPRKILVAYDFSPTADRALAWSVDLARATGGAVTALHVILLTPALVAPDAVLPPPMPTTDDLAEVAARLRAVTSRLAPEAGVEVRVGANVGATVVESARKLGTDLVVAGTHGRGALARALLGSVADHVVRHAECPVVTIHAAPGE